MKVEKKQSRESVLDKAKKLAISKAVDQYAESYEKKSCQIRDRGKKKVA